MVLATTFEMVLDAEWLRANANPIDCFNQIRLINGRYVDFDTLLHVQRLATHRRVEAIYESSLVHPSQLICQYTDLVAGRHNRIGSTNRFPVLCYFMNLGNPDFDLTLLGDQIADEAQDCADAFGSNMNIAIVPPTSWAWMEKQIRRLEQRLYISTRPNIENFLRGFIRRAGNSRTVGIELVEAGGVPDS